MRLRIGLAGISFVFFFSDERLERTSAFETGNSCNAFRQKARIRIELFCALDSCYRTCNFTNGI